MDVPDFDDDDSPREKHALGEDEDDDGVDSDDESQDVEDMVHMSFMSLETIRHNLHLRYSKDDIYTAIGCSILVAINPYKSLPIYSMDMIKRFAASKWGDNSPHVFGIAEQAYRDMMEKGTNQSMIVSGESGSGKTETTKFIIKYLTHVVEPSKVQEEKSNVLAEQLVLAGTLLESYGNACTVLNYNSSRYGKFIQVQFDDDGLIKGARISQFLLEKSRLVHLDEGERNYHIFYELVSGAPEEMRKELKLGSPGDFRYLNQSSRTTVPGYDEKKQFQATWDAMRVVDISDDDCRSCFKMIAAILHLGNINFSTTKTVGDPQADIEDEEDIVTFNTICDLLCVERDVLKEGLCTRHMSTPDGLLKLPLSLEEARGARDALAKKLYSALFVWLIERLNKTLDHGEGRTFIAILDIFGFENFTSNSFEQMNINYANEKLQQFFNQHIFKLEEEEYKREGIEWTPTDFDDNIECLNLIESKLGIIDLLDEESRFPKGSDESFLLKLTDRHKGKQSLFAVPPGTRRKFDVGHYAGTVRYDTKGFLEKNKDQIQLNLLMAVATSKLALVQAIAEIAKVGPQPANSKDGSGGLSKAARRRATTQTASRMKAPTVAGQFKASLAELKDTLAKTNPYFVRCIRPNTHKCGDEFHNELVLTQLKYSGMLETIRIRQSGFPIRFTQKDFVKRYKSLNIQCLSMKDLVKQCRFLLTGTTQSIVGGNNKEDHEGWRIGLSKVFMKETHYFDMESRRQGAFTKATIKIQATWKMYKQRQVYLELRRACVVAQKWVRMHLAVRWYKRTKNAAVCLQSAGRAMLQRLRYARIIQCVIAAQAQFRMFSRRRQYLLQIRSAILVQAVHRSHCVRVQYLKTQRSIVVHQSYIRMYRDRRIFLSQKRAHGVVRHWVLGFLTRRRFQKQRASASKLQLWYRNASITKKTRARFLELRLNAVEVQSCFRALVVRRNRAEDVRRIIACQAYARGFVARVRYAYLKSAVTQNAATLVQSFFRMWQRRKDYVVLRQAAVRCQAYARGRLARREFAEKTAHVVAIQSAWRARKKRDHFLRVRELVVHLQSHVRAKLSRLHFLRRLERRRERNKTRDENTKAAVDEREREVTEKWHMERKLMEEEFSEQRKALEVAAAEAAEAADQTRKGLEEELEQAREKIRAVEKQKEVEDMEHEWNLKKIEKEKELLASDVEEWELKWQAERRARDKARKTSEAHSSGLEQSEKERSEQVSSLEDQLDEERMKYEEEERARKKAEKSVQLKSIEIDELQAKLDDVGRQLNDTRERADELRTEVVKEREEKEKVEGDREGLEGVEQKLRDSLACTQQELDTTREDHAKVAAAWEQENADLLAEYEATKSEFENERQETNAAHLKERDIWDEDLKNARQNNLAVAAKVHEEHAVSEQLETVMVALEMAYKSSCHESAMVAQSLSTITTMQHLFEHDAVEEEKVIRSRSSSPLPSMTDLTNCNGALEIAGIKPDDLVKGVKKRLYKSAIGTTLIRLKQDMFKSLMETLHKDLGDIVPEALLENSGAFVAGVIKHIEADDPVVEAKPAKKTFWFGFGGTAAKPASADTPSRADSLAKSVNQATAASRGSSIPPSNNFVPDARRPAFKKSASFWKKVEQDSSSNQPVAAITNFMSQTLSLLRSTTLPPPVIGKVLLNLYSTIAAIAVNTLLRRSELCTPSNALRIKNGLSEIEGWCIFQLKGAYARAVPSTLAREMLEPISQACQVLIMASNASTFQSARIIEATFPALNVVQIRHFVYSYSPDDEIVEVVPLKVKKAVDGAVFNKNGGVSLPLFVPITTPDIL
eukprot:TRINITY_DN14765_c0_g1_i1.p1 TRINITY_DN14765_c0_g1~~TRINITY_DN14765_c0_g1_i1.p1  ORF type:complete len:1805 (-),score=425.49 TRINITY_DN14765_c0_g1_i1:31-5445(-)